jgi:type VI secretion system lysozyme-like protein
MSREVSAGLLPLFDRLGDESFGAIDSVLLDAPGLMRSLERDLSRLMNTRNGSTIDAFLAGSPDVLNYGLPDVTVLWPSSKHDRDKLAEVLEHAIAAFEPRLTQVMVQVSTDPEFPARARVLLAAAVRLGRELRRVDFRLAVDARDGVAEFGA